MISATGRLRARSPRYLPLVTAAFWPIWGCSQTPPSSAPATTASVAPPPKDSVAAQAALTEREADIVGRLRADVQRLAGEIGERNLHDSLKLASATDLVARDLETEGYEVNRLGFMVGEEAMQNVEAILPGKDASRPTVIVGAHYDTVAGSPGADDNASGVAAVLELARAFKGRDFPGYIRFAFFPNEEAPYFQTESMGSLVYAKHVKSDHLDIRAMLSIESIGYFSRAVASQRYPEGLAGKYPTTGDFIAVVGNPESAEIIDQVRGSLGRHASIPFVAEALPPTVEGVSLSDQWSFWQVGYKAVMVTDTAKFRNPHYHTASDLPNTLDYDEMARVVSALEHVVAELAGAPDAALR